METIRNEYRRNREPIQKGKDNERKEYRINTEGRNTERKEENIQKGKNIE